MMKTKDHASELGVIAYQWFDVMRKCGDDAAALDELIKAANADIEAPVKHG